VLGGVGPTFSPARHRGTADDEAPHYGGAVSDVELVVVGGGNMGAALLGGLLDAGAVAAAQVAVVEVLDERREMLRDRFPGVDVVDTVPACEAAVLAVKPPQITAAAAEVAAAGARRILSIAAGVRLATIEAVVGADVAVVRAMPNTPALVGLGAAAVAGGGRAGADDVDWAASILSAVGTVERLPEGALDAFTGTAGSGPAYVFLVAEALIDAAVADGLDRDLAERVVARVLLGSATMLAREGDPESLRRAVTSPGGTTAAGLAELEARDLRGTVAAATAAATNRSRELG